MAARGRTNASKTARRQRAAQARRSEPARTGASTFGFLLPLLGYRHADAVKRQSGARTYGRALAWFR